MTYTTGLPLPYITCCLYIWVAIFTIIYTNIPLSTILISLSMYALKKAPGMPHILSSLPSCVSIVAVVITESVENVGEVTYLATAFLCYFLPSTHVRPFTIPYLLTFKKISDSSASHFCSLVRCSYDLGQNLSLM